MGEQGNTSKVDKYAHLNESEIYVSDVEEDEDSNEDKFDYGDDCFEDPNDENGKRYVPRCPDRFKPFLGQIFDTLDDVEKFYREYAKTVGFDARCSTSSKFWRSNMTKKKHFVCSREGKKNKGNGKGVRANKSKRNGCTAKLIVKANANCGYVVATFIESHNHEMLPTYARHFLKGNKKLNIGHQKFMLSCAKANMGPVKSHKLLKEMVGGYCHVGAMQADFKNFKRDAMSYVKEADAQMVINRFKKNKEICSAFCFEYDVNENGQLTRLFWCDPIARQNYAAFGDVVSFDSTYRTNKYCMVFAPFTGLDNHKKCVTFAGGLLMKEDVDSYTWLFDNFLRAMGNAPRIIVTDQDCAMKIAVEQVFPRTRHRLCMWHIMSKVSTKVGSKKINSGNFRKTMGNLVWSDKHNEVYFEEGWKKFIIDYKLGKISWFEDMYALRAYWIPAYVRDVLLGGLVRTTSISESQNSFFGSYCSRSCSLVELLTQFESAMDIQRYNQTKNDIESDTMSHDLKTPLMIEKHASEYYTLEIFLEVQEEIYASCFFCSVKSEQQGDEYMTYDIKEDNDDIFHVKHMVNGNNTSCSCNMYTKVGLPCRHIFSALKAMGVDKFSENLLLSRWRKGAANKIDGLVLNEVLQQSAEIYEKKALLNQIWSVTYSCIGLAENDKDRLRNLLNTLKGVEKSYLQNENDMGRNGITMSQMVESFAGVEMPQEIVVKPPAQAKNKGSGKKRLQGGKEKAIEKQAKKCKRVCKTCGEIKGHDSRNCPLNKEPSSSDSE